MPILLRDYQTDIIARARQAMHRSRRVLLQAPTGAGKTALASFMAGETAARNQGCWFICHRAELVQQTSLTFRKFGIAHGFIAAGHPVTIRALVQICSIDTLKNRLAQSVPPKVAIVDEAHHSSAAGWALVIRWLTENGSYVIGLSATPQRLDGQGLDEHFDEIVLGPQVRWLIEHGYLSPYRIFAPDVPDMKGVRRQMGDFGKKDAADKMDKPKLTGNIITHWRRHAEGLRTVAFGVTVAHSQHLAEQFTMAGIPAAHLDGGTPKGERKRIIQDYAAGMLKVLTNVDLFGEGFDLSAIAQTDVTIDAVIQARPTQSLSLHLQQVGRALRPAPGKVAIILDHAGNLARHGYPDVDLNEEERVWTLEGREKGKSANDNAPPPPVICDGCFNAVKRPLPDDGKCPHCKKLLKREEKPLEVAEGELKEVDDEMRAALRQQRNREQAEARTLDELVALGHRRGYSSPVAWARKVFAGRRRA